MKPVFAYYGGKTRLAPWIASMFPEHKVYVEPFAGSAAVLFAKAPCRHEIINDLDGQVVNFYRQLRERPEDLELAVRLTPYSRAEYFDQDPNEEGLDDLERARRWYCRCAQSFARNGTAGTGWSSSIKRNSNMPRTIQGRIGRFAEAVQRLERVTIENRDALQVIDDYGDARSVVYADPPYLDATRSAYSTGRRPNGEYVHEFAAEAEHRALAAVLRACPGAVFLSCYPSPLYEELYEGWFHVERKVVRGTAANRQWAGHKIENERVWATEQLWTNRPFAQGRLEL